MHVFLDAGGGNILAFFELPSQPRMDRDRNNPAWVQHLALECDSEDTLLATKQRLEAAGIEVLGPTDHTIFKSIYFFDPNGHRLELAANTATPEMMAKLDEVKWDMLEEWTRTKRAPKHAAWMHDGSLAAPGPSQRLDYELELGFRVGTGNALGEPIAIEEAEQHLFGVALFNDWSARDIQPWEYQPLGPFLSKNFGSTLSPWVVTMEALAPFRAPLVRPGGDPEPLPYLNAPEDRVGGALDIELEVWLQTAAMREAGLTAVRLTRGNARDAAYWTPAQLVAHHTVGGCNLHPGDLFGSGTLSGPGPDQAGSLLELTQGAKQPITLPNGETRSFLADGDTLTLRGWCQRAGARRIGFGVCSATVLPAPLVRAR